MNSGGGRGVVGLRMIMRKCKVCGYPRDLTLITEWKESGTILDKKNRLGFRSIIIEADFLSEFTASIEEQLGVPIQHIVYEAQRNSSIEVINSILGRGPAFVTRIPGVKRLVVSLFCRLSVFLGMSYAKVVSYQPGVKGEAVVRNPFHGEMMAAIIVGAFEALEKKPFSHTWKKMGGDDVIIIEPEPSRPEIAQRLTFTIAPPKPGHCTTDLCSRCGMPLAYRDLQWRPDEGIIMDTRRGVRMMLLDIYAPMVVVRELASELGDEVYPMVVQAHKAFSLRHLREEFLPSGKAEDLDAEGLYGEVFKAIILRGQGNPVDHSMEGGRLTVTVENPFNEHLLAGYLSALYELVEGRESAVVWEQLDPSTIRFTVSPA
jgi:hypothetical protein